MSALSGTVAPGGPQTIARYQMGQGRYAVERLRDNLLVQFAAVSFVMLAGIALVLAFALSGKIRSRAVDDLVEEPIRTSSGRLLEAISSSDFDAPMSGDRYDRFGEFVQRYVLSDRTPRVKLWSRDGTIIYSDDAEAVGTTYPGKEDLAKALAGGTPVKIVTPSGDSAPGSGSPRRLMEVYASVTLPGEPGPIGVLEIDQEYDPTGRFISDLRRWVIAAVVGGFAIIYGFLVLVVWRGWKTIK